jgi:hypothetical protein
MRPLLVLDPGPMPAPTAVDWATALLRALPPTAQPSGIALVLPATAVMAVRPAAATAPRAVVPAVRVGSALAASVAIDAGAGLLIAAAPLIVPGAPLLSELPPLRMGPGASEVLAAAISASFGEPVILPLPSPFDASRRAAIAAVVRAAGGRGLILAGSGVDVDAAIAEGTANGALVDVRGLDPDAAVAAVIAFDRAVRAQAH